MFPFPHDPNDKAATLDFHRLRMKLDWLEIAISSGVAAHYNDEAECMAVVNTVKALIPDSSAWQQLATIDWRIFQQPTNYQHRLLDVLNEVKPLLEGPDINRGIYLLIVNGYFPYELSS
ncbi:hypothetical protein JCM10207_008421 [Rhodosporidiobolus poonsookiae]